jgi:hypothetical protein
LIIRSKNLLRQANPRDIVVLMDRCSVLIIQAVWGSEETESR